MGLATQGIFLKLLILQWREGFIPSDPMVLLRLIYTPPDPMRSTLGTVQNVDGWQVDVEACLEQALECFISDGKGGLYNETLEALRTEQDNERIKRSEAGRIGGLTKARNSSNAVAPLEHCYSTASDLLLANGKQNVASKSKRESNTESNTKAKALSAFVIPNWVPKEAWDHYEEMRRRIRKPMTDQARKWGIETLARLRAQGHNPIQVLEQSVFNSWQGLFAPKEPHDSNTQAGRSSGQRPNTQVQRWNDNLRAVSVAVSEVDGLRSPDSPRQTPQLGSGSSEIVDQETRADRRRTGLSSSDVR